MSWVMHHFGETLVTAERGGEFPTGTGPSAPNPCAEELGYSATPFGAHYYDFSVLDVPGEHIGARERLTRELYNIDDLELSLEGARRLAYAEPTERPSAYALAVMMNLLTPGSDALTLFSDAIDRLMGSA